MKKVIPVIFVITLLFAGYCSKPAVQTENQEETIKNVIKEFYMKFDVKDFPGMISYCRDDFQWYSIDGKKLTKNQLEAFFAPITNGWNVMNTEISFFDVKVEGNIAIARFGTRLQVNGDVIKMKNLHTMVFIYQFGEWKLWHHQESTQ